MNHLLIAGAAAAFFDRRSIRGRSSTSSSPARIGRAMPERHRWRTGLVCSGARKAGDPRRWKAMSRRLGGEHVDVALIDTRPFHSIGGFTMGRQRLEAHVPGKFACFACDVAEPLSVSHSIVADRRLICPKRCSTAATMRSRTSSPLMPSVVATWPTASRSQQSSAKATRTFPALSQAISKPSKQRRLLFGGDRVRAGFGSLLGHLDRKTLTPLRCGVSGRQLVPPLPLSARRQ
jgi:hypothetical protein